MRIVRFSIEGQIKYGILVQDTIQGLGEDPFSSFAAGKEFGYDGNKYSLKSVKLLAPCLPSKVLCLGLNYRPHIEETREKIPTSPIIFIKPSTAVVGPDEPIILPRHWKRVDYEGELGVVIGKEARFISKDKAKDHILGYTCVNDVTERQMQKDDGQWTRAKGFDTFAPIGPWIETEAAADNLKLETWVNNESRQSDRTSSLIFDIPTLINFISEVMTLLPGDIISTGTPAGIGPLKPGDVVEIKIEKIGTLRNPVLAPGSP